MKIEGDDMENLVLGLIIVCVVIYISRVVWKVFHSPNTSCSSGCENCPFNGECCNPNAPKLIIKEVPKQDKKVS